MDVFAVGLNAGTITVTVAEPVRPSLVAVICAVPVAIAVTIAVADVAFTVATAALPLLQATVRPVSALPAASRIVAVNVTVSPTPMDAALGATVTKATGGGVTVMAAVPDFPSLVAVIVADPAATPVTNPVPETLATASLPLVQPIVRPVSAAPPGLFTVAASCTVDPAASDAALGVTSTDATDTGGVPSPPPPHADAEAHSMPSAATPRARVTPCT